jgi:hypothetical protein
VIRRHVLAALHVGVLAGDDEAAREVLCDTDWVLRASARRELSRVVVDAALMCGEHDPTDREGLRHVYRVAALNVAGRFEVDVTSRDDVAALYETLQPPRPSRAPIVTMFAGSAVVVAVLLLVWLAMIVRTPTRPIRPPAPLVTGAFFHGGTPARDEALESYVVTELTDLVVETDAARRGSSEGAARAKHAAELRDSPVIASRGPALAAAWRKLIDALDQWTDVRRRGYRAAEVELGRRAQDVSDQFAALGLGLYLQADTIVDGPSAHAAVFVFAVEEVAFVRAGGRPRRVLSLRRLDQLALRHTLLGRQGDELGDPVVLLDQIDDLVKDRVMPTLFGSPYPLGDAAWRATVYGGLAHLAGDAIRRELETHLGPDTFALRGTPEVRARVSRIIAASVRRHEARHAIDHDRETPLRYPAALAAYLPDDGSQRARRAHAELAGYLSQIGNEPVAPQFALWNLASLAFNRARWQTAEHYVGIVVIEGLARQLGTAASRPAIEKGQFYRQRLAETAAPLAAQSSDKLRAAARQLWIELYGEPMLPITDLLR